MEHEIRRKAEERVERRISFFMHLASYFVINTAIFLVWFFVTNHGKGFPWFVIPLAGWGIGVVAHFFNVFVFHGLRERLIEREMERIQQKKKRKD
jgi:hypothetical protein